MKAITKIETCDEDFITQAAQGYENIPKGTKVDIIGVTSNLYGNYFKVKYNGIIYYIDPRKLEILKYGENSYGL